MKKLQFTLFLFATTALAIVQTPVLKWEFGGNEGSWCESAWYSSPTIIDINGDGTNEVLRAANTLYMLNGTDGSEIWKVNPEGSRVWTRVEIKDINSDGELEIISAHNHGYLNVMDSSGTIIWSRHPTDNEIRALVVADLDFDGQMEILVCAGVGADENAWLYNSDGSLCSGWPQQNDSNPGSGAYGVFNDTASVGNLDDDDELEIVIPCDISRISAYNLDGSQVAVNEMYTAENDSIWGAINTWESLDTELRGWGSCEGSDRKERNRFNFDAGTSVITDIDNDGKPEVIVTGRCYECPGWPPSLYNGVFIFNSDRSRFTNTYDWTTIPVDTGSPLSENYSTIENCQPNVVVVDIDGNGEKEILYPSYDGKMHCFWLDKTEHHNWPYSVKKASESFIRFATEPVVADLDNDGFAEVIFASWVEKSTNTTGQLHILNYQGTLLQEIDLPLKSGTWNGALAAPALGDIDGDPDLEVVVNTVKTGACAYDLPGTENATVLWKAGRIGKNPIPIPEPGMIFCVFNFGFWIFGRKIIPLNRE